MYKRKQTKKSGKYIIEWWDDLQHNTIFDVVKYSESSSIFFLISNILVQVYFFYIIPIFFLQKVEHISGFPRNQSFNKRKKIY